MPRTDPGTPIGSRLVARLARIWAVEQRRIAATAQQEVAKEAMTDQQSPPQPLSGSQLEAYITRLALNPRRWVRRRVESFTFVDAHTVRRRMSIDFVPIPSASLEEGQLVWIPVLLVTQRDLRALDLQDAEGTSVPLMTDTEAGKLIAAGLSRHLAGWLPPDISNRQIAHAEDVIGKIVIGTGTEAVELAKNELAERGALADLITATKGPKALSAAQRSDLTALIRELASSRLLLAQVPYKRGQRQVVKLSYDAALETGRATSKVDRLVFLANQAASAFGLTGRLEVFDGLVVGLADSYHAEVIPPPDTYVSEVEWRLRPVRRGPEPQGPYEILDDHPYRPHVRAWSLTRGDTGRMSLLLHARREALLAPLLLSGFVIALTLAVIPRRLAAGTDVDAQTVAALLLVPFALSAYYVRSSEHVYVTRMLRGVRVVALVPVIGALLVIAMLAVKQLDPADGKSPPSELPLDAACVSARASMLAVALLVVAMAAPAIGTGARAAVQAFGRTRLGPMLAAGSFLAGVTAATVLLIIVGLPSVTAALIGAVAVAVAWLVVSIAVAQAARLHAHGLADIRRLPQRLREATVAALLLAEVAVALVGGWLSHAALAGPAC